MVDAHAVVAVLVILVAAAAAVSAFVVLRLGREPRHLVPQLLALAQTVLIAQIAIGLLLLSDDRRAPDDLHYAYGSFALAAVIAPWLYAPREPRARLLWFAVATLVAAALAVRAYMTGSG